MERNYYFCFSQNIRTEEYVMNSMVNITYNFFIDVTLIYLAFYF